MWDVHQNIIHNNQVIQYKIYENDQILSYGQVIDYWIGNANFRNFYTSILNESPFKSYYWENPSLINSELYKSYEFTLTKSQSLDKVNTEPEAFKEHFTDKDKIVVFPNLRRDATLIVPTPQSSNEYYCHLAKFLKNAPADQIDIFWCMIGKTFHDAIKTERKWLSTAGMGVYWLHARIDSRPKYYRFKAYINP